MMISTITLYSRGQIRDPQLRGHQPSRGWVVPTHNFAKVSEKNA